ncbi:hypothetical protein PP939_gp105 [Rhizobium phage RL38J1]|uniref:Uncharacterized protein n=1 Tax=Rhizobium phage RL38J1 TaxID=2663232 RepID=A0A6B9J6K7_9CAUD|nr:hypothetical protein PP939_gp105 [Rhizobium phage RL38J1]QGZ13911.1 hypothetical protein RL38J1_105 [Rhizobium phage RL38J1]
MKLIYNGTISSQEAEWCQNAINDYPYAIELSKIPDHAELQKSLKVRKWNRKSWTMSHTEEYESILYSIVQKNFLNDRDSMGRFTGGCFIFLKDADDYYSVIIDFREIVVNKEPFMVSIETKHDYGTTADGEVFNHEEVGETSWIDRKIFRRKKWYRVRYVCNIGGSYHVSTEFFDERP